MADRIVELDEKLNSLANNATNAQNLEEHIVQMKSKKYERLQEQYRNDEISDEELERRMDDLMESGDDFLDAESPSTTEKAAEAGKSLRKKLAYYALPVLVLLPIAAVILLPGINPMMAVVAAPPLLFLGLLLYGAYWARKNL